MVLNRDVPTERENYKYIVLKSIPALMRMTGNARDHFQSDFMNVYCQLKSINLQGVTVNVAGETRTR